MRFITTELFKLLTSCLCQLNLLYFPLKDYVQYYTKYLTVFRMSRVMTKIIWNFQSNLLTRKWDNHGHLSREHGSMVLLSIWSTRIKTNTHEIDQIKERKKWQKLSTCQKKKTTFDWTRWLHIYEIRGSKRSNFFDLFFGHVIRSSLVPDNGRGREIHQDFRLAINLGSWSSNYSLIYPVSIHLCRHNIMCTYDSDHNCWHVMFGI